MTSFKICLGKLFSVKFHFLVWDYSLKFRLWKQASTYCTFTHHQQSQFSYVVEIFETQPKVESNKATWHEDKNRVLHKHF